MVKSPLIRPYLLGGSFGGGGGTSDSHDIKPQMRFQYKSTIGVDDVKKIPSWERIHIPSLYRHFWDRWFFQVSHLVTWSSDYHRVPLCFFHSDGRDQHKVATDRLGKVPRGSKGGIPSPSPSLRMLQIEVDAFCEIHFHSREQIPGWHF